MNYTFEKSYTGLYQVRLEGEFVTYSQTKDSDIVDNFLIDNGFLSRVDFLNSRLDYYLSINEE